MINHSIEARTSVVHTRPHNPMSQRNLRSLRHLTYLHPVSGKYREEIFINPYMVVGFLNYINQCNNKALPAVISVQAWCMTPSRESSSPLVQDGHFLACSCLQILIVKSTVRCSGYAPVFQLGGEVPGKMCQ